MRYPEISRALILRIRRGEYPPGAVLPSEAAFAQEFQVSRGTARRGLQELERTGWVVRSSRRWTVPEASSAKAFDLGQPLATWARANGREPTGRTVDLVRGQASTTEARVFGVPAGSSVMRMTRWGAVDGRPVLVYRATFAGRLEKALADVPCDASSVIETLTGRGVVTPGPVIHELGAVAAGTRDSELLDVPRAAPLLRILRTARTDSGETYEHGDLRFVPAAIQLRVESAGTATPVGGRTDPPGDAQPASLRPLSTRKLMNRLCSSAVLTLLGVGAGLLAPEPASAHPFGAPQTADITSTTTGLQVHWQASPDDVTALAVRLGVLEGMRTFVFEDGALVPEESDASDGVLLADSPRLVTYLLEHITAAAGGSDCEGVVLPVADVTVHGATVEFDCGGSVRDADVRITMLTDLHEAYVTMAQGPGEVRRAYSKQTPVHAWEFREPAAAPVAQVSSSGGTGASAALQMGGVLSVLAVGVGGLLWWRRRVRRTTVD